MRTSIKTRYGSSIDSTTLLSRAEPSSVPSLPYCDGDLANIGDAISPPKSAPLKRGKRSAVEVEPSGFQGGGDLSARGVITIPNLVLVRLLERLPPLDRPPPQASARLDAGAVRVAQSSRGPQCKPKPAPKQPGSVALDLPADIIRRRIIDSAEAAAFLGFSLPHFRRLYRANRVPLPIRLSSRKYGWRLGDLIDFIDQRTRDA